MLNITDYCRRKYDDIEHVHKSHAAGQSLPSYMCIVARLSSTATLPSRQRSEQGSELANGRRMGDGRGKLFSGNTCGPTSCVPAGKMVRFRDSGSSFLFSVLLLSVVWPDGQKGKWPTSAVQLPSARRRQYDRRGKACKSAQVQPCIAISIVFLRCPYPWYRSVLLAGWRTRFPLFPSICFVLGPQG